MHTEIKKNPDAKDGKVISGEETSAANGTVSYKRQFEALDDAFVITTKYSNGTVNRILYNGSIDYISQKDLEISETSILRQYTEATYQPSIKLTRYSDGGDIIESKITDSELLISYKYTKDHPFFDGDHDDYWEHGGKILSYSSISPDLNVDGIGELSLPKSVEVDAISNATPRPKAAGQLKLGDYFPNQWWLDPFSNEDNNTDGNDTETANGDPSALGKPAQFKKKFADKITNFNPSSDTLEIDTDSFGIDNSATFAAGASKKEVKKVLAKQDVDFLYDEKKGGLYFNENGSDKGFGDGGIIAILKGAPDLTASNLEFN